MHSTEFPVINLCQVMQVSRSAYYDWQQGRADGLKEKKGRISREVKAVFEEHLQRYGSRRIEVELKENGTQAGRYQIRKRMKEQGLKAIQPKSFVPKNDPN